MDRMIIKRALLAAVLAATAGLLMLWLFRSRIPGAIALAAAVVTTASGIAAPRAFLVIEKFNATVARVVGVALTWILLTGLYWIYFVPGRGILAALGKDPVNRKFRDNRRTYWEQGERPRGRGSYRRQY